MQDKEPTYYYHAWKFPLEEVSSADQHKALSALFNLPSGLARVEVYIAGKKIFFADRSKESRLGKNVLERLVAQIDAGGHAGGEGRIARQHGGVGIARGERAGEVGGRGVAQMLLLVGDPGPDANSGLDAV